MASVSRRWMVVFASCLGLMVGSGSISTFAFGVFLKSMSEDLGMNRSTLSLEITISSLVFAIGAPFGGRLVDRVGVRQFLLTAIFCYALAVASFSLLTPSVAMLIGLSVLSGLAGVGQTPLAYSKVVSEWFDGRRGLALGLATAGVGLGTALVPQYAGYLLRTYGWREAFVGLGVAIMIFAFVPVALFVRSPSSSRRSSVASTPVLLVELRHEVLGWRLAVIAVAFFLQSLPINGTLTHLVPLLMDRGLSLQFATTAISMAGVAIITARVITGFMLDRLYAPYVGIAFIVLPIGGLATLVYSSSGSASLLGAILCGLGIGAEVDLLAYLISRYFRLRHFGFAYGVTFGLFLLGTSIGPLVSGWSFDHFHSYDGVLLAYIAPLLAACVLLTLLGPYKYPPRKDEEDVLDTVSAAEWRVP